MKRMGFVSLILAATALAEDLASTRKRVEKWVAALPVVAHFDQPYAGTTNPKQMVDLYLPKERTDDKLLPVVVFIHGGGWTNGDRIGAAGRVLRFVRTGDYAGVTVGYRLSGEAKWPAQIYDCKAAIRWIRGNAGEFGLDPDHIGVWGRSRR